MTSQLEDLAEELKHAGWEVQIERAFLLARRPNGDALFLLLDPSDPTRWRRHVYDRLARMGYRVPRQR